MGQAALQGQAARQGQAEKCAACSWGTPPELWAVNVEAWQLWQEIRTQLRAGGMGVIGVDYQEVRRACREMGFIWSRGLKSKIMAIERVMLNHVNQRSDQGRGRDL